MDCPHLDRAVGPEQDLARLPGGCPSSWSCSVCSSTDNSWLCLTCLQVHCGRYVNAHALRHFEDTSRSSQENSEIKESEDGEHCVCMDCANHSVFCYRCDEFVANDTASGQVQKLRVHLQSLEESQSTGAGQRKRKLLESDGPENKIMKANDVINVAATGLRNLGNTCFMNAILQSLSNIEQFNSFFKDLPAAAELCGKAAGRMYHTRSKGDPSVSLVEEVRKTLCSLWKGNQTAFSPDSLFYTIWKLMPSFRGYQQQDAHEFMRYLLDHLHKELQSKKNGVMHPSEEDVRMSEKGCVNGNASVVTSVFGGLLQNEVNCLVCGTESRKFDPFLDLSLDIPSQFRQKRKKDQEPGPTCTLRDCLQSFTDLEELDETELYYCHTCKMRQKSTKKFWIKKLPKVLCLHLKRFHWTTFFRNKVDTYVKFPMRGLDMRGYLLEPEAAAPDTCLYDLAAIVVHHGSGIGSGHYTAYGSHEGRWYHFNDSTVTLTSEEAVTKAKAYILFYAANTEQTGVTNVSNRGPPEASASSSSAPGNSASEREDAFSTSAVTHSHTSDL